MKLNFFGTWSNPDKAVQLLLKAIQVKVTDESVKLCLEEHPDYPSLLSISDCLNSWNVDHQPVRCNKEPETINNIPVPFIAYLSNPAGNFALVSNVSAGRVTFSNENVTNKEISIEEFNEMWNGVMIQISQHANGGEKDYHSKKSKARKSKIVKFFAGVAIPLIVILIFTDGILFRSWNLPFTIYGLLSLFGLLASTLLIWYDIDQYNPVVQQICRNSKKLNCDAVLKSKHSKIFGISWSAIGVTYFTSNLFFLIFSGPSNRTAIFIASLTTFVAAAYIVYSLYYQWLVIKQWCILCLNVQLVLFLQFIIVLTAGWYTNPEGLTATIPVLFNFALILAFPSVVLILLLPALRRAKENMRNKTELQRLKHNSEIFAALLERQKKVTVDTTNLGITLGNKQAKTRIIKVCNPYCPPCAAAHPDIECLLHTNPNLQVQVIFTATGKADDMKTLPVQHLLDVASSQNETLTRKALADWYLANKKEYKAFAAKYPIRNDLNLQTDKIDAMYKWCREVDVQFTPTFFLSIENNEFRQLPELYKISDLNYFLAE